MAHRIASIRLNHPLNYKLHVYLPTNYFWFPEQLDIEKVQALLAIRVPISPISKRVTF